MPVSSPKSELAEIRNLQRRLRQREAEILAHLHGEPAQPVAIAAQGRPGWPMQRLIEHRAG